MNKKGQSKFFSVWWFYVLAVIGVGIITGVLIYHSADININKLEAEILAEKIMGCLVDNNHLDEGFFEKDFDIFSKCRLNKEIFARGSNFYFNITVSGEELNKEISEGDHSFEENCKIEKKIKAEKFPKCVKRVGKVFREGKRLEIVILAGSNQAGGVV